VSGELSAELRQKLRAAMLALDDAATLPLLTDLYGVEGLRATTGGDYLGAFGRALAALPGIERTLLVTKVE
jgi:ABC-type phosphate/phosphonate transport system substrate-binding protein